MNVLVCEVREDLLRYALFNVDGFPVLLAEGSAAGIGAEGSFYHKNADSGDSVRIAAAFPSWCEAICAMLEHLFGCCISSLEEIAAVAIWGYDGHSAAQYALRSMLPHTPEITVPAAPSRAAAAMAAAGALRRTPPCKGE